MTGGGGGVTGGVYSTLQPGGKCKLQPLLYTATVSSKVWGHSIKNIREKLKLWLLFQFIFLLNEHFNLLLNAIVICFCSRLSVGFFVRLLSHNCCVFFFFSIN